MPLFDIKIFYTDGETYAFSEECKDFDHCMKFYKDYAKKRDSVHHIEISQRLVNIFPDEDVVPN